jgi:hypothetical protein
MIKNFLLTYGSSVLLTSMFAFVTSSASGQKRTISSDTTNLCDVIKNLASYVGKEIEVEGKYEPGFEMVLLEPINEPCPVGKKAPRLKFLIDSDFENRSDRLN